MLTTKFYLLAFLVACLEYAFQEYMLKGMVLFFYKKWLKKLYYLNYFGRWIMKPLGGCKYCHGFWLSVLFYLLYFPLNIEIVLFTGLNYFIIKIMGLALEPKVI